jgi:hypothetical protein
MTPDALSGRLIQFAEHPVSSTTDTGDVVSVHSCDLDGDNDVDLVAAAIGSIYSNPNNVTWFENDGNENFTMHIISEDFGDAKAVFCANVDGDGDMDVVAGHTYYGETAWFENDGDENFTEHFISSIRSTALQVIDLDGDTDMDIVGASSGGDDIVWWENDGSQVFTIHTLDSSYNGASAVYAIDMDSDDDLDILGSAQFAGVITWWENDGSQDFTPHTIEGDYYGAYGVHAVDLEDDGDIDVLGVSWSADEVAWWENDGAEGFTKHVLSDAFDLARAIRGTDLDGDGNVDILAGGEGGGIAWWENDGNENFSQHTIDPDAAATAVHASDIDGDSDLDVLGAVEVVAWWEHLPNAAPELTWTGEANYVDDGLHPEAGEPGAAYVYRVAYSDANSDPPGSVQVHIKKGGSDIAGSPFAMSCDTGDYVAGVICTYTKAGLDPGTDYSYLFVGQDDQGSAATPTGELDAPDVVITYPTLDWPGDANYETDGLHPELAEASDDYVYRVKYADAGGDPPGSVQVHIKKGGTDIVGSPFAMSCDTGDYVAGVVCTYTKTGLDMGTDYSYLFVGQDDHGNPATPTQELTAPDVIAFYKAFLPLVLVDAGPPQAAPVLDDIEHYGTGSYTVSWSSVPKATTYVLEEDNDPAFPSPVVVYDEEATSTSVDGQAEGTYYYRVRAVNSFGSSEWSATKSVTVGPPAAPKLEPIENDDGDGTYTVHWSAVAATTVYTLEEASTLAFTDTVEVYAGSDVSVEISGRDLGTYYYRVKASNDFGSSGWSEPESVEVTVPGLLPQPGVWDCTSGPGITVRFTVSPDSRSASDGYIRISCGSLSIPGPEAIEDNSFGLLDPDARGHISLTFDSETHGSGGFSIILSDSCWAMGTMHCSP